MQDSDSILQLIADTTPALLAYFDAQTLRCRFANASYANYFGFTIHSIVGRTVQEIAGDAVWQEVRGYFPRVLVDREPVRYTRKVTRGQEDTQYLETVLRPHVANGEFKGLVALVTDVSHHYRMAQQMRDSEERMRKFAEITTEAIVLHQGGIIMDGNEALTRLSGYTLEELCGRHVLDYIAPEYRAQALEHGRRGSEDCYESMVVHKSGRHIPVEVEGKSMPGTDRNARIVLLRDLTANRQAQEHMDFLAQHDPLTRLPNRARLHQLMTDALSQAFAQRESLAILSVDIDHFKAVNDSLSHHAGDLLLCEMAQRLRSTVRPQDVVARMGGDDFVVVLTGDPTPQEAEAMATQLCQAVEAPCDIEGTQLVVSLSMGIAMFPDNGETPEKLLSNAEAAMHMAKDIGRRPFQFYTATLESRSTRMLMQEQELRRAVEQGEFELHYQPQIATADGALTGLEALVRWRHPQRGLVYPNEFIGLAESLGLISEVGRWVLRQACRQVKDWQNAGFPVVPVAINLSAQEFLQRDVAQDVAEALWETGLDARYLHIELTESTLMQSGGQMSDTLHALKALGVSLAIDDFGTGYSSLAYLRRHPIDKIKIDRSFVTDVPHDPDATAIVNAIVQMSHSLHLQIVAEGVETQEQLDLLRSLDCTAAQGYLISRPLPAEQTLAWMSQHLHKP
jgi:diguanylate cyclase (GGDEF)-like protein/PAS domain S-box-containing protein